METRVAEKEGKRENGEHKSKNLYTELVERRANYSFSDKNNYCLAPSYSLLKFGS
jgi:hypothetical protein